MIAVGLWAAILQHVRTTLSYYGNKLNSISLASGIALLAMQCYFIKKVLLQLCPWVSTMAFPFVWSPSCYLGKNQREPFRIPCLFFPTFKLEAKIIQVISSFWFFSSLNSYPVGIREEASECELSTNTFPLKHTSTVLCPPTAERKHYLQDAHCRRRFCWYIRFIYVSLGFLIIVKNSTLLA